MISNEYHIRNILILGIMMSKEEYIEIGKKYNLDYCIFNNSFYFSGKAKSFNEIWKITEYKGRFNGYVGYANVYNQCIIEDGDIITSTHYEKAYNKEEFEKALQKFQKSYKKALIELKKCQIEKDFK